MPLPITEFECTEVSSADADQGIVRKEAGYPLQELGEQLPEQREEAAPVELVLQLIFLQLFDQRHFPKRSTSLRP